MIAQQNVGSHKAGDRVRPVILTFTAFYLPGYRGGGPIRSIANLVERLGDEFDFRIVTFDHDLHDLTPYDSVNVDTWNEVGKAHVFYASDAMRSLRGTMRIMRDTPYDLLYLNSFFDPRFTSRPLLVRLFGLKRQTPVLIAPRGEFSEGAYRLKRWKKVPFTYLSRQIGLHRGVIWHASTEYEAQDIRQVLGRGKEDVYVAANVAVAPDLLAIREGGENPPPEHMAVGSPLRVCFLSRISAKKNLDYALKVLGEVRSSIRFTIYGPIEDKGYWQYCQTLIQMLPENIVVIYAGALQHEDVVATLAQHDLFFVPTRGENFGHVFVEAWSAGLRVLISDQTPWRDLEAKKLGWDISLDEPQKFVEALEVSGNTFSEKKMLSRQHCMAFARKLIETSDAIDLNRQMFYRLLRADPNSSTVSTG